MIKRFLEFITNKERSNNLPDKTMEENKEVLQKKEKEEPKNNQNEIPKIKEKQIEYQIPPITLLDRITYSNKKEIAQSITESALQLQRTLYSFGVQAKVKGVVIGPTIITYEIMICEGISVKKVKILKNDLALNLGTKILDIKIIPEKQLIGIETERKDKKIVKLREIIESEAFNNNTSNLTVGLGKDIYGNCKIVDLKKTSHMLISGTTGSGKSMFLHILINSILYKAKPNEVKFLMIDTKAVELSFYNGIPHMLIPVITDRNKALGSLAWIVEEINNRYLKFANKGAKNIEEYNEKQDDINKLPEIILIIDEYADLIEMDKQAIEQNIYVLTQKARATGIYLILVTERPSIKIINGTVKANIPTRISFKLPSQVDSRVVLDVTGAENLLGNGDMLLKEIGTYELTRCQGAFISNKELEQVVDYIKMCNETSYDINTMSKIDANIEEMI